MFLANAGPGPATDLVIKLWVFRRLTPGRPGGVEVVLDEHGGIETWGLPNYHVESTALGAGSAESFRALPVRELTADWDGPHGFFVAWHLDYTYVFGHRTDQVPTVGAAFYAVTDEANKLED